MGKGRSILVVDDSQTQLAVLKDALEADGFSVETAANGMEAITRVYQSPPALVLSDVMMPELNGYHLCRLLKDDPHTAHLPVILLTNLRERHDRFWGEKAGADRYLEKTADLGPILASVRELALDSRPEGQPRSGGAGAVRHEDIQMRVTATLDRLLYESTISNEILKLTGLAHDSEQLVREFLRFLAVICRYSMAALLIGDGRDKYLLALDLCEGTDETTLAEIRRQVSNAAGLKSHHQTQIRQFLIGAEHFDSATQPVPPRILYSRPITDRGELLAQLVLFHSGDDQLSDGTRHALDIVADRFLIVARYQHKIKEIEQVKADFVSMLVHDLRAPLTSIRGFTNVLAEGVYGSVNPDQRGALDNVENGCDCLLSLIEDILELSKLEAGKLRIHPSPVLLRPLLERSVADLAPLFAEKSITPRIELADDLPYLLADAKQLARVLTNLLSNAIKFTPEGGTVTLSAEQPAVCPTRLLKDCLQVCVTDTGSGIPPELQGILFGRFQQLPNRDLFRKGTGLGLAICREIVTLHGGEIWVESPVADGVGSRFQFTIPLAE